MMKKRGNFKNLKLDSYFASFIRMNKAGGDYKWNKIIKQEHLWHPYKNFRMAVSYTAFIFPLGNFLS